MSRAVLNCAFFFAIVAAAQTTDKDVQELFTKARKRVTDNLDRTPRYTCVENITRVQYEPPVRTKGQSCAATIEARNRRQPAGTAAWRDRLRIDVAVVDGQEMFSWAGDGKFETSDLEKLIGTGSTGSGDFASFLTSVFGDGPEVIRYRGLDHGSALFEYNVPLARSHYTYHTRGPEKTIGYGGSFSVDPADGELQRLIVRTEIFPGGENACQATDQMDYHTVKIGAGDFLLPEMATMDVVFASGTESVNETRYSDCREYVGESTIRFDDVETGGSGPAVRAAAGPLPPGLRLQIALTSPINGQSSVAGDAVTGIVVRDVKDKGVVVIHAKDRVHGRIVRLEQWFEPSPKWILGLKFDSIERGGVTQPVALQSASNGVFHFQGRGGLALDQKFQSEWETR